MALQQSGDLSSPSSEAIKVHQSFDQRRFQPGELFSVVRRRPRNRKVPACEEPAAHRHHSLEQTATAACIRLETHGELGARLVLGCHNRRRASASHDFIALFHNPAPKNLREIEFPALQLGLIRPQIADPESLQLPETLTSVTLGLTSNPGRNRRAFAALDRLPGLKHLSIQAV